MTTTDDPKILYEHIEQDNRKRRKGWECPRCGTVHAPHVDKCDCKPKRSGNPLYIDPRPGYGPSEIK